ncbi:MAG: FAD-binding protein [Deltaproteobacteria bacterium]|nr:FAD-binding protein [Deltaproteobacteria bacterium]
MQASDPKKTATHLPQGSSASPSTDLNGLDGLDGLDGLRPRPSAAAVEATRRALNGVLKDTQIVTDADALEVYATDWSSAGAFPPDLVVKAESTSDVVHVLQIANTHGVPVTPRGLGTGKAGGALPLAGGIVLSLERMSRLIEINPADMVAVVEPGLITGDLMSAVEDVGLFYPPDPNSFAICSIGGNVACNAGGPRALKYGVTRPYVLGLQVVLPTGERIEVGARTLKHVAGYDLTGLIVGSEGTLGVITEITLRLVPKPGAVETALVTFKDTHAASLAITRVFGAGVLPRTLEFLDHHALSAIRAKTPGRFPENAGALLILETDGPSHERAFEDLSRAAEVCSDQGALDVLVAQDEMQRTRIWEPRRVLSMTLTESAPHKISEDIVVPRSAIATFLERVYALSTDNDVRVATYGHAGDGNLHVNVLFDDAHKQAADRTVAAIMAIAVELRGTISGEHGVGLLKRAFMPLEHAPPVLALQRRLKKTLDPQDILNPGKILPLRGVTE